MKNYHFSTHSNHHHTYNHHHHHQQQQPQPHHSNYEAILIDEVIYLHSLWHRGPPNPNPYPYLKPTHTTHFKRKTSDKPWPVPKPTPSQPGTGWPAFPAHNKPITRPATSPERARALGLRIQLNGVESCCGLFRDDDENDGDDDDDEEEEDGDDDEEELDFFENLFEEEKELREFYVRNCENDEFYCLVCGVIGRNNNNNNNTSLGRKFKDCVALVQHSMSVSKTKKRKAHRVYGNVVCKVLGWDVNRLPSLPSFVEVTEGSSLSIKDEVKNHADQDSTVVEMENDAVLTIPSQSETETIADALEKDNVPCTNAGCIAIEPTNAEGEVKNQNDEDNTAVEMVGHDANASQSQGQALPEGIPNAFEKDNVPSTDVGCIASAHSESERKDTVNGCKADDQDSEKDIVCSNSEIGVYERSNNPELHREESVKKFGEEFIKLGSKPVECESSVAGNDPFEQLQSLPGVFQLPD